MIGIFNSITIDGVEIFRPNEMPMQREDVYAGEYTTCTGKTIADRIGWKYADMSLKWDALTDAMLTALINLRGSFNITFTDFDGTHTEAVVRDEFTTTPTRMTDMSGQAVWTDVAIKVRFLNVHTD